jgi:hypothetical protein
MGTHTMIEHSEPPASTRRRLRAAAAVSILCVTANGPAVAQDPYLDPIESELQGLESDAPAQPGALLPGSDIDNPETESIDQFEQILRSTYPGSYYLMKKLPEEARQSIYQEYLHSGDMERVRDLIVKRALNRP